MFELNNLGVYVASPLQLWLNHLDSLEAGTPPQQQQAADAYTVAGMCVGVCVWSGGGGDCADAPPASPCCSLPLWTPPFHGLLAFFLAPTHAAPQGVSSRPSPRSCRGATAMRSTRCTGV